MAIKICKDGKNFYLPDAEEISAKIDKTIEEKTQSIIDAVLKQNGGVFNSVDSTTSYYGFPSIGKPNIIYKAEDTGKLYQWKTDENGGGSYEELTIKSDSDTPPLITRINGGNANTIFNDINN
jgi:hypothetical protein